MENYASIEIYEFNQNNMIFDQKNYLICTNAFQLIDGRVWTVFYYSKLQNLWYLKVKSKYITINGKIEKNECLIMHKAIILINNKEIYFKYTKKKTDFSMN